MHGKLDVDRTVNVSGRLSRSRMIGATGPDSLSGHGRVTLLGRVEDVAEGVIEFNAIFVGSLYQTDSSSFERPLEDLFEIRPEKVDQFQISSDSETPGANDLKTIREAREEDVKQAFARIIGEPFLQRTGEASRPT
jgi:hypothetical protein